MTISTEVVAWMFFAIVALAALAIVTNYAIVRVVLTGRALAFERRENGGNVAVFDRGRPRESER